MDLGKTYRIFSVIIDTEKNSQTQSKINNINSYIQNYHNLDKIEILLLEIQDSIKESHLKSFTLSDLKILRALNMEGYFDESLIVKLRDLLSLPIHIQKDSLNTFVVNRNEKLTQLLSFYNSLSILFPNNFNDIEEKFEIVFGFPGDFHEYDKFTKTNRDIKNFLSEINQRSQDSKELKISSVNNGCIEIFIEATFYMVEKVDLILEYIGKIYGAIQAFNAAKEAMKRLNDKRKKMVEKQISEQEEEEKETLIKELIDKLDVDENARTNVRNHFLKIAKYYQQGLSIEIKTPFLNEPQDINEEDSENQKTIKTSQKKFYEKKKTIDLRNKEIRSIQNQGAQLYLPEPQDEEK